jgi:hypothetical protein
MFNTWLPQFFLLFRLFLNKRMTLSELRRSGCIDSKSHFEYLITREKKKELNLIFGLWLLQSLHQENKLEETPIINR